MLLIPFTYASRLIEFQMLGTGGSGVFNCTVHGGRGSGVTLSWQHEGRPLHAPQSRLSLGPVRSHHAGLYQCTAYDHMDTAVSGAELMIAGIDCYDSFSLN